MKLIKITLKKLTIVNFLMLILWFCLRFYRETICGYLNLSNDYLAPESYDNVYAGFLILILHMFGAECTFIVSCILISCCKLLNKKYTKLTSIVLAVSIVYIVRDWILFTHL